MIVEIHTAVLSKFSIETQFKTHFKVYIITDILTQRLVLLPLDWNTIKNFIIYRAPSKDDVKSWIVFTRTLVNSIDICVKL